MTVKELIKHLEKMPEDAEVVVVHDEWSIKKLDVNKNQDKVRIL